MHWELERNGQRLRWHVHRAADGTAYELVLTPPDGPETVERFEDPTALIERSLALQESLLEDGWRPPNAPQDPDR
jgi:hypothetical protein